MEIVTTMVMEHTGACQNDQQVWVVASSHYFGWLTVLAEIDGAPEWGRRPENVFDIDFDVLIFHLILVDASLHGLAHIRKHGSLKANYSPVENITPRQIRLCLPLLPNSYRKVHHK